MPKLHLPAFFPAISYSKKSTLLPIRQFSLTGTSLDKEGHFQKK
jgi:hypothetical protein